MNRVNGIAILAAFLSTFAHAQGVGSSGGGSGIVLKTGEVLLTDLADSSVITPDLVASEGEITKLFFTKKRYVKIPGTEDSGFFDCAIQKISASHVNVKDEWIKALSGVKVVQVQFRLIRAGTKEISQIQTFPLIANSSARFDSALQVPLAAYSAGELWVQSRFYNALSDEGKCGLSIHEAIRHLNLAVPLTQHYATDEIEQMTSLMMQGKEQWIADVNQRARVPVPAEISDTPEILEKMKNFWSAYYEKTKSEEARAMITHTDEMLKVWNEKTSKYLDGEQMYLLGKTLSDAFLLPRIFARDHRSEFSSGDRSEWIQLASRLRGNISMCFTSSAMRQLSGITLSLAGLQRAFTSDVVTRRLPLFKFWDVQKQDIVTRPWK